MAKWVLCQECKFGLKLKIIMIHNFNKQKIISINANACQKMNG